MSSAMNGHVPPPGKFETVMADGQVWKLSHINPGIRKAFAAWVEQEAMRRLHESRSRLGPAEWNGRRTWLTEQIMAGAYDWGFPLDPNGQGSAVTRALSEGDGPGRLMQLFLEEAHGEVPIERIHALFAEQPEEIQMKMKRCLDPNSASPSPSEAETGQNRTQQITSGVASAPRDLTAMA